jgi:hypothetical protein
VLRGILEISEGSTADASQPAVARTPDGTIFVAWQDRTTNGATHDIYFRTWNGAGCSPVTRMSATPALGAVLREAISGADNRNPAVAATPAGDVHLVWEHHGDFAGDGDDADVLHAVWRASSGTIDATVTVVSDTSQDSLSPIVAVAPDGGAHVVWAEQLDGGAAARLQHRAVGDGAMEPSADACAGQPDGRNGAPGAAYDTLGRLHVVFQGEGAAHDPLGGTLDEDIFYCMGDADGTWGAAVVLSDATRDGRSLAPDVAALPSGDVAVVWHDSGAVLEPHVDLDVYMRTGNGRDGFDPYILVSSTSGGVDEGDASDAAVAVDAATGDVHVVWVDQRDILGKGGDPDVLHRVYDPAAGALEVMTDFADARCSVSPDVAVGAGGLAVVWQAHVGPSADRLCRSNTGDDRDVYMRTR